MSTVTEINSAPLLLLIPASNDGIILQKHNEVHIVGKIPPKFVRDILAEYRMVNPIHQDFSPLHDPKQPVDLSGGLQFMKRLTPPLISIGLSLLLALLSAALTYSAPSNARAALPDGISLSQPTPATQTQGKSQMGSTDQIIIMGGVIIVIIVVPIILMRSYWR